MTALVVYLQNTLFSLRERQEGQTMAEYALILGGIAVVVIAAIVFLGGRIDRPVPLDRLVHHEPGRRLVGHQSVRIAAVSRMLRIRETAAIVSGRFGANRQHPNGA